MILGINKLTLTGAIRLCGLLTLAAFPIVAVAEPVQLATVPVVGQPISPPEAAESIITLYMVSPGQMDKCFFAEVDGVTYTVAYRAPKDSDRSVVTYLSTADPDFVSPERHRVGDVVEVELNDLQASPGFEIYAGPRVGQWSAVGGFGGSVETIAPDGEQNQRKLADVDPAEHLRLRITAFSTGRRW